MIYRVSKGKYKDYVIEYEKEDDGRWIASYPKISGCMVYGDTKATATLRLIELIREAEETNKGD